MTKVFTQPSNMLGENKVLPVFFQVVIKLLTLTAEQTVLRD